MAAKYNDMHADLAALRTSGDYIAENIHMIS